MREPSRGRFPAVKWSSLRVSLPKGVEPGIYAELITMARERGVKTILNTTEPALIRGLEAQPFLVKPISGLRTSSWG